MLDAYKINFFFQPLKSTFCIFSLHIVVINLILSDSDSNFLLPYSP